MSTILKALRRLEDEKRTQVETGLREAVATPAASPSVRQSVRRGWLLGVVSCALVLALSWIGYSFVGSSAPEHEPIQVAEVAAGAPPLEPSSGTPEPSPRGSLPPLGARRPATRAPSPPPDPVATPEHAALPHPSPVATSTPTQSPVAANPPAPTQPPVASGPVDEPVSAPALSEPAAEQKPVPPVVAKATKAEPKPPAPKPAARSAKKSVAAKPAARTTAKAPPKKPAAAAPAPVQRSAPAFVVLSTVWHPVSDRRKVVIEMALDDERVELQEGDQLGPLRVSEIKPTGVVFDRDGKRITRSIGSK